MIPDVSEVRTLRRGVTPSTSASHSLAWHPLWSWVPLCRSGSRSQHRSAASPSSQSQAPMLRRIAGPPTTVNSGPMAPAGRGHVVSVPISDGTGTRERGSCMATMTPRSTGVLRMAADRASQLGHDYVGTEHILLAILDDTGGVASSVVVELGVADSIRERLLSTLESPLYQTACRSSD